MPTKYEYDRDLNIVNSYPYGRLSISEIVNNFKKILNDNEIKPGFLEVVRFNKVEDFLFSSIDAEDICIAYNNMNEQKRVKGVIFVGESSFHYGMARMIQTLHEIDIPDNKFFVVRNEKDVTKIISKIFA